ncbi:hypothetical protein JCM33774_25610 [Actinophytocola sp. KF-1]
MLAGRRARQLPPPRALPRSAGTAELRPEPRAAHSERTNRPSTRPAAPPHNPLPRDGDGVAAGRKTPAPIPARSHRWAVRPEPPRFAACTVDPPTRHHPTAPHPVNGGRVPTSHRPRKAQAVCSLVDGLDSCLRPAPYPGPLAPLG